MKDISRALLAAAVIVAAASPAAPQAVPTTAADVPRIEGPAVKKLVEKDEAVRVDVRSKEAWDTGHAEGALHIPLDQLSARLKELPREKLIAAYCT